LKQINEPVILSTAYLPNIQYVSKLLLHSNAILDIHETYLKQSFRNRCVIYGANGIQNLTIPVIKPHGNRTKTKDIQIEYDTNWMQVHWKAIVSAYKSSPFFEIFEDELHPYFQKKERFLIDFNQKLIFQLFKSLGLTIHLASSTKYIPSYTFNYDFRNSIHPKPRMQKEDKHFLPAPYYQVFANRHQFQANLSFIDLMVHEGPQALTILQNSTRLK
jgi:hypothetical protein